MSCQLMVVNNFARYSSLVDGCYHRAVQLLGDMEDCVRSSAIRVVASWGLILAASNADMKSYWSNDLSLIAQSSVAGALVNGLEDEFFQTLSQHPKLRVTQSIETPSLTFPALGLPFGKTSVRRSTSSPPDCATCFGPAFLTLLLDPSKTLVIPFDKDLQRVMISTHSIQSSHTSSFSSILFTMVRRASLKDLDDSTDRWAVVVRVFRKWNVYQKSAPAELFCGRTIQASVLNKNLLPRFHLSIKEGQIYKFTNFEVTSNINQYRATSHPFKITFTSQTYSAEDEDIATIPSYAYSFFPISEIMKIDFRHPVDNLIGNDCKFQNNEVECTLFDNCASDAYMAYLQNTESPVVVLLNFERVGFSEDGTPQVYSSFNATRALFNPSITEDDNIPDELDVPVGKNVLLKLKMNDYNKKHPTSSISVSQYTICEDLLNQFNEANAEGIVERVDAQNSAQNIFVNHVAEGVTPPVTPLEDSSVSDLSQHATPAPVKGKRRTSNKRNVVILDDLTATSHVPSTASVEERASKMIKQEK
ncbi:hypothetical protein K1719_020790 [Acacia pycnantha]|nr:hypothetical protein K1719_020790 [Acacia pycnantha]